MKHVTDLFQTFLSRNTLAHNVSIARQCTHIKKTIMMTVEGVESHDVRVRSIKHDTAYVQCRDPALAADIHYKSHDILAALQQEHALHLRRIILL